MPESLVFSCAKILFLVSLLFVAVKDQSLLTYKFLILHKYIVGMLYYVLVIPQNEYGILVITRDRGYHTSEWAITCLSPTKKDHTSYLSSVRLPCRYFYGSYTLPFMCKDSLNYVCYIHKVCTV